MGCANHSTTRCACSVSSQQADDTGVALSWRPAGLAIHALDGALFGLAFHDAWRILTVDSRKLALGMVWGVKIASCLQIAHFSERAPSFGTPHEERRKQAGVAAARHEALKEKLDAARQSYIELLDIDAQTRGYRLQSLLSELFSLFDLDPKASFALEGEQIDGAFSFENADYLLESKWQKDPIAPADLRDFDEN